MMSTNSPDTKLHAFNMLFNLSIHINLLEDGNAFFDVNSQARDTIGETPRMKIVQQDLYSKVCEMILQPVYKDEPSPKVWNAALSCWLFFVAHQGMIKRKL